MLSPRAIVNSVSLSRIPIAFLFLISFKPGIYSLYVSAALAILAFLTDVADGFLARRFKIASGQGRHVDSLSDKAFYIAVIVSFHDNDLLGMIVTWGLLVREVGLYATRIIYVDLLPKLDKTRFYTKTHGYFLYAVLVLGFVEMFFRTSRISAPVVPMHTFIQISAWLSLVFGVASIAAFLRLRQE